MQILRLFKSVRILVAYIIYILYYITLYYIILYYIILLLYYKLHILYYYIILLYYILYHCIISLYSFCHISCLVSSSDREVLLSSLKLDAIYCFKYSTKFSLNNISDYMTFYLVQTCLHFLNY